MTGELVTKIRCNMNFEQLTWNTWNSQNQPQPQPRLL